MTLINISSATEQSVSTRAGDTSAAPAAALTPSYAAWYNAEAVHDIERRALPEFTADPSAEAAYLRLRNFMVDAYRTRPQEYLSVTLCRRQLTADVGSIYRVHAFLEQWGLINYHVNTSLASSGIIHPKDKPSSNSFHAPSKQQSGSKGKRQCAACAAECVSGFYGLTRPSFAGSAILCLDCFAVGKLVEGTASADYTFIHTPVSRLREDSLKEWTEEDELRLLEAIELHPSDWAKVAEQVGRSKEACILHFLQLDCMGQDEEGRSDAASHTLPSVSPFSSLENPVIGTVAFLASLVHPKVAAEAAKAAIQSMSSSSSPSPSSDHTNTSKAAVAAFAIAAKKAHDMAKEEEQIIEHLRDAIVLTQMKKVQLKLSYLEALERNVLEEKADLEKQRMVLFLERVNLKRTIMGIEGRFVKRDADMDAPLDQSAIVQPL